MRPDLWRQAEELFHAALERPSEERRAYLDIACGQDTELRRYVELLVSGEENAGSFLDKAGAPDLTGTIGIDGSLVGRQFGHYRIVSPLGKGGMGEVYRALDTVQAPGRLPGAARDSLKLWGSEIAVQLRRVTRSSASPWD